MPVLFVLQLPLSIFRLLTCVVSWFAYEGLCWLFGLLEFFFLRIVCMCVRAFGCGACGVNLVLQCSVRETKRTLWRANERFGERTFFDERMFWRARALRRRWRVDRCTCAQKVSSSHCARASCACGALAIYVMQVCL